MPASTAGAMYRPPRLPNANAPVVAGPWCRIPGAVWNAASGSLLEMPDCFISYSSRDQKLADFVCAELKQHGLEVFMATVSLKPGEQWSETIRLNLKTSSWIIFLASRAACASAYVQQELGIAMGDLKRIIPIVWDMDPSQLPGWTNQMHAINLRGMTLENGKAKIASIATDIKKEKEKGILILGALFFGLLLFAGK